MNHDDILYIAHVCGNSATSWYKGTFHIDWTMVTNLVNRAQSSLSDKEVMLGIPFHGQIIIRILRMWEDLPLVSIAGLKNVINEHPLVIKHPAGTIAFSKVSIEDAKIACYESVLFDN